MKRAIIEALVCIGLMAALVLFWRHEIKASYERGVADTTQAIQQQQISDLAAVIEKTEALVSQAEVVSQNIERSINARQSADQKTTQEMQRALSRNSTNRVDCHFDADVMQQLTTARDRANQAAAFGISYPMSSGTGTD